MLALLGWVVLALLGWVVLALLGGLGWQLIGGVNSPEYLQPERVISGSCNYQIEVFKILTGYENIDRNMFFSLKKDSRTRGHEVKLVKDQCRLDIRKHSFSQRTINEWNKLSTDCVTASSVNMFKNKVDTYLRRAGYK